MGEIKKRIDVPARSAAASIEIKTLCAGYPGNVGEKPQLEFHDLEKKKILMICPSFDCAGVSYSLCEAINKYSDKYTARQVVQRRLKSFQFKHDLVAQNYETNDWECLIAEADILHFNFGLPDEFLNGAIQWDKYKNKTVVYHSHSGWELGKDQAAIYSSGEMLKKIHAVTNNIVGCSVVDASKYPGGKWMPNVLRTQDELTPMPNKDWARIIVSHSPSAKENKSTAEFEQTCESIRKTPGYPAFTSDVIFGVSYDECLKRKRKSHLHFDNMYQGYHGMASFEAMAQGIPTMARLLPEVIDAYKNMFGSCPIINVRNGYELKKKIIEYVRNLERLKADGEKARRWIEENYTPGKIVALYESYYAQIEPSKTPSPKQNKKHRILLLNHRHGDTSWTRGAWLEKAFIDEGHSVKVFKNEWMHHTTVEIVEKAGRDFDFAVQLAEYSCPKDMAEGQRLDHSFPLILWTDDSVVWNTFNRSDNKPHFQGLHYRKYIPLYDAVFELFPQSMPMINSYCNGHGSARLLMHSWEPSVFFNSKLPLETDVLFCGRYEKAEPQFTGVGWYLDRGRVIEGIKAEGIPVKIFFSNDVTAWTKELCSAKIVLNKSLNFNINMRFFETLGAGRFLLTDRALGAEALFEDKKHLVYYDNPHHAAELIKYYLSHESEREEIARQGHEHVIAGGHTYRDRAKELVKTIGERVL